MHVDYLLSHRNLYHLVRGVFYHMDFESIKWLALLIRKGNTKIGRRYSITSIIRARTLVSDPVKVSRLGPPPGAIVDG